jgi:hypothetical protein
MLFLSPLLLWFLAASVPVMIHLINRRRHKTIQWAAMQFLLKASRESRGKKKLRHILILTCRALASPRWRSPPPAHRLRPHRLGRRLDRYRGPLAGPLGVDGGQTRRRPRLAPPDRHRQGPRRHGRPRRRRASCSSTAQANAQEIPSPEILDTDLRHRRHRYRGGFPRPAQPRRRVSNRNFPAARKSGSPPTCNPPTGAPMTNAGPPPAPASPALPQKPAIRVLSITGPTAANTSVRLLGSRRSGDELLLDLEILRAGDARGSPPSAHHPPQRHPHHRDPHPARPVAAFPKRIALARPAATPATAGSRSRPMATRATTPPSSPTGPPALPSRSSFRPEGEAPTTSPSPPRRPG